MQPHNIESAAPKQAFSDLISNLYPQTSPTSDISIPFPVNFNYQNSNNTNQTHQSQQSEQQNIHEILYGHEDAHAINLQNMANMHHVCFSSDEENGTNIHGNNSNNASQTNPYQNMYQQSQSPALILSNMHNNNLWQQHINVSSAASSANIQQTGNKQLSPRRDR